jgi:hypothetical protein
MCAMLAFLAALALVSSLRWALPIDEGVFQWMQFHRSCSWIAASRWIDPVVRAGLALLVAFALVRRGRRDPRSLAPLVLVFFGGLAIVELLKTAIERLRRLPHKVTGMTLVLASLAFFVFDDLPATRFGLPSALDESRPALVSVEFGTPEARAVLGDGWEDGPPSSRSGRCRGPLPRTLARRCGWCPGAKAS